MRVSINTTQWDVAMTKANIITTSENNQTMSSIELLKVINKARKDFGEKPVRLNDFNNRIADELSDDHYETFVVQNPNNTTSTAYKLTLDQCILIGMRETKSVRRYVLAKIKELELKLQSSQLFALTRQDSKFEYKAMGFAIAEAHEEIKPYHFSNEADLINKIVLGCTASKYRQFHDIPKGDAIRDYLNQAELDCIVSLQRANTVYIEDGIDFQERKEKLTSLYNRKHKQKIINEIHLLNA